LGVSFSRALARVVSRLSWEDVASDYGV
jgi:hypothetical protein